MPNVPPDPRAVINARIHHFKKQTQKLNLEVLEAEKDLERAKQAVRQGKPVAVPVPTPTVVVAAPIPAAPPPVAVAVPMATPTPAVLPVVSAYATVTVRPFADGVGYSLTMEGTSLWFDNEIHAVNYAQEVFPDCEIVVLQKDGSPKQHYGATSSGAPAERQ
jgi:hypothetical protein